LRRLSLAFWTGLVLISSASARAVTPLTFTVNSTADAPDDVPGDGNCHTAAGTCTLRAAIQEANAHPGADTINLPAGTYLFSRVGVDDTALNGDLDILDDVTITGAGPTGSIIDGARFDRVFQIGTAAAAPAAAISGVTIQNGTVLSGDGTAGGGVNVVAGALSLVNCIVSDNSVQSPVGTGGGIANAATLTLDHTTVSRNFSGAFGVPGAQAGGISSTGTLTLLASTVTNNAVVGKTGAGGGIAASGTVTIVDSTISINGAPGGAGGLWAVSGIFQIVNSTISQNGGFLGSGLFVGSASVNLLNTTIAFNHSSSINFGSGGQGVSGGGASGVLTFVNSVIADNTDASNNPADCSGTLNSLGFNIVSAVPAGCTITGPYTLADPQLGPLADNGGPTRTHAIVPGSPAIDAGNPAGCGDQLGGLLNSDQRGFPRPVGAACDIGAVEYGPAVMPFSKNSPSPGAAGLPASVGLTWQFGGYATSYEYCVDLVDNNTCDSTWHATTAVGATIALSPGTTYYWQVRAINTYGALEANGGEWWKLTTAPALQPYPPDRGDLTGDGKPDLIWQHPTTSAVLLWEMNGSSYVSSTILNPGGTGWRIVGTADFTGDGKADLLWQQPSNGAVLLWEMNGATYVGSTILNAGGTNWKVVGAGDLTGDGKADIVWQDPSTGAVLLWQMNGSTYLSSTILNTGSTLWQVVGVGDINGDGKADLIWQHPSTGAVLLWVMNGTAFVNGVFLNTGGTLWQVVANGDFTGDGKRDLIWQHPATGAVLLWEMNGTSYVSSTMLNSGGTLWRVKGPR